MNVNRCAGFKWHGQHCCFLEMEIDENGKPVEDTAVCRLRGRPVDEYRLIPEHDSASGRVIHNNQNFTEFVRLGPDIIWETVNPVENGLTFTPRKLRVEDFNTHPLYTIKDVNEPKTTSKDIGDNTILVPFGDAENLAFSSVGWKEQDVKGLERIDKCFCGLYGEFNLKTAIITDTKNGVPTKAMATPKCIKDQCGQIPDWINYTMIPPSRSRQYTFFVAKASNRDIVDHCIKWFGPTMSAAAIAKILIAIRGGEYINMYNVLDNHGIDEQTVKKFMRETNTRTKDIFKPINLLKYWLYYTHVLCELPYIKGLPYRANLVNFLLNNPANSKINPNEPDAVMKDGTLVFSTPHRYWHMINIIMHTYYEDRRGRAPLLNKSMLPDWLVPMINAVREKRDIEDKDFKNPGVKRLKDIVEKICDGTYAIKDTEHWHKRAEAFADIVRAGQRWTLPEIKSAWVEFCRAYDASDPRRFWSWVEAIRSAEPDTIQNLLAVPGDIPPKRAFTEHLTAKGVIVNKNTFKVRQLPLNERWGLITPKSSRTSEDGKVKGDPWDIFYTELKRVHVKMGKQGADTFEEFLAALPIEEQKMLREEFKDDMDEDLMMGTIVDGDDIGRGGQIRIQDIDGREEMFHRESDETVADDARVDEDDPSSDETFINDDIVELEEKKKPLGKKGAIQPDEEDLCQEDSESPTC